VETGPVTTRFQTCGELGVSVASEKTAVVCAKWRELAGGRVDWAAAEDMATWMVAE
jgi:hypothetical protein